MDITVKNHQNKIRLRTNQFEASIKYVFKYLHIPAATITVIFISRQKIQALNKQYLKRSYATDVLAFDLRSQLSLRATQGAKQLSDRIRLLRPSSARPRNDKEIHGDVFISTDAALQNARLFQNDVQKELTIYVVHGILHLLGYDDHSPTDIKRMRAKERDVMEYLRKQNKF